MTEFQYHIAKLKLKAIYEKLDEIDSFLEYKFSCNNMTTADFFAVAKVNYEVLCMVKELLDASDQAETGG